MMAEFKVISRFQPSGDQERAINSLIEGIKKGEKFQTLLGVTGSGKTFTMAKVIEAVRKPTLVLTHNKTLAAQLYREFSAFFPENAVEYFVSYYDYYQPEAYVVSSDLYIEKDASINDEIDRLRLKATSSILERRDVIVVSSVSCIYGLGTPEEFDRSHIRLHVGDEMERDDLLRRLVSIYYDRNNISFIRGTFRARGDVVEVFPAYLQREAYRIEFFGDQIDGISRINPTTGNATGKVKECYIYPAKHFVSSMDEMKETIRLIEEELMQRLDVFKKQNKLVEAQRLESKTRYDMEMLAEMGYCSGIENYSRIISRRRAGERPSCLLDYFRGNYLMFIDESHVTVPQVRGMYEGDRARKTNLVEYGFRLPSALDNRPLYFEEFEKMINQVVFVSATPAEYELGKSSNVVEQVIRPTGLVDPVIEIRPAVNQVDDLIGEINTRARRNERVLVTTLTKKMAEDLTKYFEEVGIRAKYLHSEINTIERVEIIRDLRIGEFDCLVGINLLREGLDLPEVSLVAILDADKEGFLRSTRSLIQTAGRAARNINGTVLLYADTVTESMRQTIDETNRRRSIQEQYNREHNITPESISKDIVDIIEREYHDESRYADMVAEYGTVYQTNDVTKLKGARDSIREEMLAAADNLEFEKAAVLRDQMLEIEKKIELLEKVDE
ncbi:MAG TPA: excinuclease ABC subunit UvrB [Spirochaetota bacterium]|nr:excinuclease ABC subunit UvrB [Spirochaetota bacterium]HPC39439.1 excinuclease ABC subunit UvrB [Spirochaetota bacterium]HPL15897.1 excinuclease ABC subunit UvrB [Spirochaetota bacterium]HQF06776.1 excinuclease ABC subunit UvrB [Spirochaetota bacterium]HQH95605.1 excinuclease ABC subunit UvrB [Spirochaetota bacterium]